MIISPHATGLLEGQNRSWCTCDYPPISMAVHGLARTTKSMHTFVSFSVFIHVFQIELCESATWKVTIKCVRVPVIVHCLQRSKAAEPAPRWASGCFVYSAGLSPHPLHCQFARTTFMTTIAKQPASLPSTARDQTRNLSVPHRLRTLEPHPTARAHLGRIRRATDALTH